MAGDTTGFGGGNRLIRLGETLDPAGQCPPGGGNHGTRRAIDLAEGGVPPAATPYSLRDGISPRRMRPYPRRDAASPAAANRIPAASPAATLYPPPPPEYRSDRRLRAVTREVDRPVVDEPRRANPSSHEHDGAPPVGVVDGEKGFGVDDREVVQLYKVLAHEH